MTSERRETYWFKRSLPKSLFGRALLIIMLPIALMQMIVAYIFFDAHWQTVTSTLADSIAADISVTVELYKQAPDLERAERLDQMLRPNMQLSVVLDQGNTLPISERRAFFSSLDRTLRRALDLALGDEFWFDTTRYPNHIDIRVGVEEGVLRFIAPRERVFAPTGFIFIFWLLTATILLSLVSILFILNQARPIVKLAKAAENFGKGRDIGNFKPSGATEVRQAGHAFLQMRQRIQRHIQQRTVLLAGVSHDLRTPLTRLKLHLAMVGNSRDNDAAHRDVEDMEQMLDGYLDFARGIAEEEMNLGNIGLLLKSVIERSENPKPLLTTSGSMKINMREHAMHRAIANLVSNAQTYGKHVKISAKRQDKRLSVTIDDDGPGVSVEKYKEVLKPFIRLDDSRNQNIKGVGLGLSIAHDIIQAHGGELNLERSPMGGLRVQVFLPL